MHKKIKYRFPNKMYRVKFVYWSFSRLSGCTEAICMVNKCKIWRFIPTLTTFVYAKLGQPVIVGWSSSPKITYWIFLWSLDPWFEPTQGHVSSLVSGGRRSPAVACWASDHWVASSNPLRGKFRHKFRHIIPGVCLAQFSLNNVHKRGLNTIISSLVSPDDMSPALAV